MKYVKIYWHLIAYSIRGRLKTELSQRSWTLEHSLLCYQQHVGSYDTVKLNYKNILYVCTRRVDTTMRASGCRRSPRPVCILFYFIFFKNVTLQISALISFLFFLNAEFKTGEKITCFCTCFPCSFFIYLMNDILLTLTLNLQNYV